MVLVVLGGDQAVNRAVSVQGRQLLILCRTISASASAAPKWARVRDKFCSRGVMRSRTAGIAADKPHIALSQKAAQLSVRINHGQCADARPPHHRASLP